MAIKGSHLSDDQKKKLSISLSGERNPMFGKTHSYEAREKIRLLRLGTKRSLDSIEKARLKAIGKKSSKETKLKISLALKGNIFTLEHRDNLSKATIRQFENSGHPKGMLGKKHSAETLLKNSIASKKLWASFSKEKIENIKIKRNKTRLMKYGESMGYGATERTYSKGKCGKRKDLNDKFFRSSWEANYARYLNFLISQSKILKWEFEPDTFWFKDIKRGTRSYMPDFKVWIKDSEIEYHEVKGWMTSNGATKLKRMKKYYPDIKIVLIDGHRYKAIKETVCGFIKNWE